MTTIINNIVTLTVGDKVLTFDVATPDGLDNCNKAIIMASCHDVKTYMSTAIKQCRKVKTTVINDGVETEKISYELVDSMRPMPMFYLAKTARPDGTSASERTLKQVGDAINAFSAFFGLKKEYEFNTITARTFLETYRFTKHGGDLLARYNAGETINPVSNTNINKFVTNMFVDLFGDGSIINKYHVAFLDNAFLTYRTKDGMNHAKKNALACAILEVYNSALNKTPLTINSKTASKPMSHEFKVTTRETK